jgi:hypothetical protein
LNNIGENGMMLEKILPATMDFLADVGKKTTDVE